MRLGVAKMGRRIAFGLSKGGLKKTVKNLPQLAKSAKLPKPLAALKKEAAMAPVMHQEVVGALRRMQAKDPALAQELQRAHAYAVFPNVGKASVVLGGDYGIGEVFQGGRVIGYAGVVQLMIGVQVGGQTYQQIVIFETRDALERFKQNKWSFAADASAVFVKAGAVGSAGRSGMRTVVQSEGGMMLGAAIGAQKLIYKPAVLGRLKVAEPKATARQAKELGKPPPAPTPTPPTLH